MGSACSSAYPLSAPLVILKKVFFCSSGYLYLIVLDFYFFDNVGFLIEAKIKLAYIIFLLSFHLPRNIFNTVIFFSVSLTLMLHMLRFFIT